MSEPIRIDATDLTLGELAELEEAYGSSLDKIMETSQARGIAGIAWLVKRRTDPDFTLESALALKMTDLELTAGEAEGAGNGASPQPSPAPGP